MSSSEVPPPAADPIAALRAEIDALDHAILDMLAVRGGFAARLAAAKGPAAALPVRPAREVALLRALIAKAGPSLDADTIIEVWRALIGASVRRQGAVEILAPLGAAANADPVRTFDHIRRHFGASAKISRVEDVRAGLSRALDQPNAIVAAPWPGATGPGAWWPILNESRFKSLGIFAALPLIADREEPEMVLVANKAPLEPAGDDVSLAIAYDPHHRAARALADQGLSGREISRARGETVLIRLDGFVPGEDIRLARLAPAGLDEFRIVGAFARI
jgi:chorismate mutase / prephenate dehydratase